jgi:hypothetical protein
MSPCRKNLKGHGFSRAITNPTRSGFNRRGKTSHFLNGAITGAPSFTLFSEEAHPGLAEGVGEQISHL